MILTNRQSREQFIYGFTLFFSFMALTLMIVDRNNWAGWLVMGLSFWILLSEGAIRNNLSLYLTCSMILYIYHTVSFINLNFLPIDATSPDSINFIASARKIIFGFPTTDVYYCAGGVDFFHFVGACFYSFFLSYAYTINNSIFFGQEINILAVAISLVYLCKFTKLLQFDRFSIAVILLLSLFPQYLILRSISLREAWEFLLFMMVIYHGLLYRLEKKSFLYLLWIVLLCFLTCIWHNVFIAYIPCLFLFIILYPFNSGSKLSFEKFLINYVFVCILAGVIAYLCFHFLNFINHTPGVDSEIPVYLGGAGYEIQRSWFSLYAIIKTLFLDFYYYLFTPMPWQVKSVQECFVMIYVFMRIILLGLIAINYRKLLPKQRRIYMWLLAIYFSGSLIWAIGTYNYSQAIRHQMITDWIIVILGAPLLMINVIHFGARIIKHQKET
jgi:hypothetical protein